MRKLIVSINSTANDIVTGPPSGGDETNIGQWSQPYLEDVLDTFRRLIDNVDTFLLGRATYEDLVRRWPKVKEWPDVDDISSSIGEKINTTPKVVVTGEHPLERLEWGEFDPPTQLTGPNIEEQVKAMKAGDGGDIMTFGSPTLVQSLINAKLVDEFQLMIYPVIMNEGRHLFENLTGRTHLRLIDVTSFERGTIIIRYAPQPAS